LIAMTGPSVLEREATTFEERRAELASQALGKYALVHGDAVAGIYGTEREAIVTGRSQFGYVPILVERITTEDEANPPIDTVVGLGWNGGMAMEPITWHQIHGALHHFGPVARVTIGMTETDANVVRHSGAPVLQPIHGGALIDTGATFSALDHEVIAELGLQPVGRLDVAGFDATYTQLRYDAQLVFEDGMHLEIVASGAQLRRPSESPIPGYEALLGRDVLAIATLTYDGVEERVSLQFRPASPAA
jgi:hypothetical protein